jgi:preprotein translocase subunit Sec61beta
MMGQEPRKAGLIEAARAVFWSFFGVRKRSDYESDSVRLTPVQVIVMGLLGALLFIAILLGLVYLVTHLAAS